MKGFKKNSIILFLVTAVVLVFVLKDDFSSVVESLENANMIYIFFALCCFFLGIAFQARAYQEIIEEYNHKYTFFQSYRMLMITKFFNGITPFSSGGQPMQIYLLKKEGIRLTKATNIIIQNFIIYQAALVLLGIFAVTVNHFNRIFTEVTLLKELVLLGFTINTLVMLGLIFISFSNKFNHFILNKVITILHKIHIVKDKEKTLEKWDEKVDDFYEGTEYLKNNPMLCLRTFFYNLITCICSSAYVLIMGSFVPIPGASGGIEYGYFRFFGNFLTGTILKTSLLIWRTISYYIPMIMGAVLFNIHGKRNDEKCE